MHHNAFFWAKLAVQKMMVGCLPKENKMGMSEFDVSLFCIGDVLLTNISSNKNE